MQRSQSRTFALAALFSAVALLTGGATQTFAAGTAAVDSPVVRAAFYYPWFPQTWGSDPKNPYTMYHPNLGYYNSDDPAVVAKQIAAMRYANLDAAIVSWWGQGQQSEVSRVPMILQASVGTAFKAALYYEKEGFGNPSVAEISSDLTYIATHYAGRLNYLVKNGKPVIMAFADGSDGCAMATRWKQANAGRFFLVLKVFAGYRSCADQPDGWHQYAPAVAEDSQSGHSYSISPGFWRKGEAQPRLARDTTRWASSIRNMVASKAPFQLVTTFNEWGEGTATESSDRMANGLPGGWASASGYGAYIDLLHANIPGTPPTTTKSATTDSPSTTSSATTDSPSTMTSATTSAPTTSSTTPSATATSTTSTGPNGAKVLVIIDENHTQSQAQAGMPYLVSLQNTYGVTTHHTASTHPSLPNYLMIAGASTFGVADDAAPSSHPIAGLSIFGAALAQGKTARAYNETMSGNCRLTNNGTYAVKHNPWAYFVGERTACQANDVPLTQLPADISSGKLPTIGMITPNLCNDAHDCSVGTADAFLHAWIPRVMSGSDYRSGKLTIVVTFDEGVGSNQTIQTVVINPALHSRVVTAPLTHAGLSRWLYRVSGSTPQHDATTAADFGAAFGL